MESLAMPEKTSQVIERLLKQGGYVLAVGGGLSHLPEPFHQNPQILIWDDEGGAPRQEVPQNTRAIIYNSWISHPTAGKLREAAKRLGIPLFPMLKTRAIKTLLAELCNVPASLAKTNGTPAPNDQPLSPPPVPITEAAGVLMKEDLVTTPTTATKPRHGSLRAFVEAHGDPRKPRIEEARRLYPLALAAGIQTTEGSLAQGLTVYAKSLNLAPLKKGGTRQRRTTGRREEDAPPPSLSAATTTGRDLVDDLAEMERLLSDAQAAITLLAEFAPKLSAEVKKHRAQMQKLREMLA